MVMFAATLCHLTAALITLWVAAEYVAPKFGAAS